MTDAIKREAFTLRRWSQRKLAAARGEAAPARDDSEAGAMPPPAPAAEPVPSAVAPSAPPAGVPAEVPPVDSLTPDSDFAAFLRPDVDESVRRVALRKLFSDPRFNVMDGLDVYIDDFSKPDPIAPEIVRQLAQARYIFDPPPQSADAEGAVDHPDAIGADTGSAATHVDARADDMPLPPPAVPKAGVSNDATDAVRADDCDHRP